MKRNKPFRNYSYILLIILILIFSCKNEYQEILKENKLEIIDTKIFNDIENGKIKASLFIKNNSNIDINGIAIIEFSFKRSKLNKLKILEFKIKESENEYSKKWDKLVEYGLLPEINSLKFKYDSLKADSSLDSSITFIFDIEQPIKINVGGLTKLEFEKQIPGKYIGYREFGFLDKIKVIKLYNTE